MIKTWRCQADQLHFLNHLESKISEGFQISKNPILDSSQLLNLAGTLSKQVNDLPGSCHNFRHNFPWKFVFFRKISIDFPASEFVARTWPRLEFPQTSRHPRGLNGLHLAIALIGMKSPAKPKMRHFSGDTAISALQSSPQAKQTPVWVLEGKSCSYERKIGTSSNRTWVPWKCISMKLLRAPSYAIHAWTSCFWLFFQLSNSKNVCTTSWPGSPNAAARTFMAWDTWDISRWCTCLLTFVIRGHPSNLRLRPCP